MEFFDNRCISCIFSCVTPGRPGLSVQWSWIVGWSTMRFAIFCSPYVIFVYQSKEKHFCQWSDTVNTEHWIACNQLRIQGIPNSRIWRDVMQTTVQSVISKTSVFSAEIAKKCNSCVVCQICFKRMLNMRPVLENGFIAYGFVSSDTVWHFDWICNTSWQEYSNFKYWVLIDQRSAEDKNM